MAKPMRTTLVALGISLSIGLPCSSHAADFLGAGTVSCGKYTEEQQAKTVQSIADLQWIEGWLAAASLHSHLDLVAFTDMSGIMEFTNNYCAAQPLNRIVNVAIALELELAKTAPRSKNDPRNKEYDDKGTRNTTTGYAA